MVQSIKMLALGTLICLVLLFGNEVFADVYSYGSTTSNSDEWDKLAPSTRDKTIGEAKRILANPDSFPMQQVIRTAETLFLLSGNAELNAREKEQCGDLAKQLGRYLLGRMGGRAQFIKRQTKYIETVMPKIRRYKQQFESGSLKDPVLLENFRKITIELFDSLIVAYIVSYNSASDIGRFLSDLRARKKIVNEMVEKVLRQQPSRAGRPDSARDPQWEPFVK